MTQSPILEQFERFIPFIQDLQKIDEEVWEQPIAPGKWTLKELVCHLWHWDQYSLDCMAPLMKHGAALPDFVDIEQHNRLAIEKAKLFHSPAELIDTFVQTRLEFIRLLTELYDDEMRFTIGTRHYSVDSYLEIFTHHDEEHKQQLVTMNEQPQ